MENEDVAHGIEGGRCLAGGRMIRILHQHPLLTSGRTLRSAEGAFVWYDGRRE